MSQYGDEPGYRPIQNNFWFNAPTQGHSNNAGGLSMRTPGRPTWREYYRSNPGLKSRYPTEDAYVGAMSAQRQQQINQQNTGNVQGANFSNMFNGANFGVQGWGQGMPGGPQGPEDPGSEPYMERPAYEPDPLPEDPEMPNADLDPNGPPPLPGMKFSAPEPNPLGSFGIPTPSKMLQGGLNAMFPIAGAVLGALGNVPAEPQFNRIEHMDYWDKIGREKYGKMWGESERDPYQDPTGFFRSAQKASITGMNSMIENDAQKQFAQAQAGGGQMLATTGNQRALANMAPALFSQTAQNLGTGYNIRNQSAGFREDFNQRGISDAYKWHIDRIDRGMHPTQTTGFGLASSLLSGAGAGLASGMRMGATLADMDMAKQMYNNEYGQEGSEGYGPGDPTFSDGEGNTIETEYSNPNAHTPAPEYNDSYGSSPGIYTGAPSLAVGQPMQQQEPPSPNDTWNRTGWFQNMTQPTAPAQRPSPASLPEMFRSQPQQSNIGAGWRPPSPIDDQLGAFDALNGQRRKLGLSRGPYDNRKKSYSLF